jgi:uncharacterized membrane protein YhaH (DUF805 family)
MGVALEVSTQGISTDWNQANGSYDPVERGSIDSEELELLLQRVMTLQEPDYSGPEDLCGPAVHINGPGGEVSIFLDDGTLRGGDDSVEMTPHEVVALATGQEPGVVEQIGARAAANAAAEAEARDEAIRAQVVRRPEAPLTPDDLDPAAIDTGPNAPQVSCDVWKSKNWRGMGILVWVLYGFFALVVLAVGPSLGAFVTVAVVAAAILILRVPGRKMAHQTMRVGCDWATNTLWIVRGDDLVACAADANTITDIGYQKRDTGFGSILAGLGSAVITGVAVGSARDVDYGLLVQRGNGDLEGLDGAMLLSKKETTQVVEQARQMLGCQGDRSRVIIEGAGIFTGRYEGRIGRLKYLLLGIGYGLLGMVISLVMMMIAGQMGEVALALSLVASAAVLLYLSSIPIVKRLHDLDRPGKHFWLMLIPLYNVYIGLLLLFSEGTAGPNTYDAEPSEGPTVASPPPPPAPQPAPTPPPQQSAPAPPPPPPAEAPAAQPVAQPTPPQEQPKSDADAMAQLEKLADLKEKGVISAEEFEEKKKELLGRI